MPQLLLLPWFFTLISIWPIFLALTPLKFVLTPLPRTIPQQASPTKQKPWHWPW